MRSNFFNKFYDIAPMDKTPSLADLDDPNYQANLEAANKAAADKEAADKVIADAAYAALVVESKNPDGTLKEGYAEVDGKITKVASTVAPSLVKKEGEGAEGGGDDEKDDDLEDAEVFFTDVNKLHGKEIKVEYGVDPVTNLPIDPLSPQGVYIRDKVIMEMAQDELESNMSKIDPRGYAYLLHRQAGGDDEEFFSNKTISLPEYETFKSSTDLQTRIYKSSLTSKGITEDVAQMAIDKVIKDGKLFDEADKAYKATQKQQTDALTAIEDSRKRADAAFQVSVNKYNQQLSVAVKEGKGIKIVIPDTEKDQFLQFVRENTQQLPDGRFAIVRPVAENLGTQLEALWYEFKKGDFKSLIQREAQTQNVRRLRSQVEKSKDKGTGGSGGAAGKGDIKPDFVPLSAL